MAEEPAGNDTGIPVPSLGTQAPSGDLPPLTGVVSDAPRRRRRSGKQESQETKASEPVAAPAQPLSPQAIEGIGTALGAGIEMIFATLASMRGDHWRKTPEECNKLGALWAVGLDSAGWLAGSGKYVPLAVAALTTAGTIMPSLQKDQELARMKAGESQPNEKLADGRSLEVVQ